MGKEIFLLTLVFSLVILLVPLDAFADHITALVSLPDGSGVPGCEQTNQCFIPASVTIDVGGEVIWSNDDTAAHTVTSGTGADGPDGYFDSSLFMAGATYSIKFDEAGTYEYFCMVHPWMVGEVIVSGDSTTPTPTPAPAPTPIPTPTPTIPSYADILLPEGSGVPGCEETNECYIPATIRVDRGDSVTWYNGDTAAHTVTSGTAADGPNGNFDSSLFIAGATFSHNFQSSGTFQYFCMVHPWMVGTVIVGTGTSPPPPTPGISLHVFVDEAVFDPGDIVNVEVEFTGAGSGKNVAVSVNDPSGMNIISRTITTDSRGNGDIQFKLSENARGGMYQVDATASLSGVSYSDTTFFSVHTEEPSVSIVRLQATDQQGNPVSSFERGKMGFVKVILNAASSESALVTVNLFDSQLTSLGIGSFKTTLSSGDSEILLSFFIPADASSGTGNIYTNVFSDWPSQGGTPLTGEASTTVNLR